MKKYFMIILSLFFILISFSILSAQETGNASWYGEAFHGKKTASGELFDMNDLTAAHRTHPFGTLLKVTNIENNKSVIVRVNDRGPYVQSRIVDLSKAAFAEIASLEDGVIGVTVEVVSSDEAENNSSDSGDDIYINNDSDKENNQLGEGEYYRIQFGAFKERTNAVTYAEELYKKGIDVKVFKFNYSEDKVLYKVISNDKFDNLETARKYEKKYKNMGIDCFIIKLKL